jgi:hypothetical protein
VNRERVDKSMQADGRGLHQGTGTLGATADKAIYNYVCVRQPGRTARGRT